MRLSLISVTLFFSLCISALPLPTDGNPVDIRIRDEITFSERDVQSLDAREELDGEYPTLLRRAKPSLGGIATAASRFLQAAKKPPRLPVQRLAGVSALRPASNTAAGLAKPQLPRPNPLLSANKFPITGGLKPLMPKNQAVSSQANPAKAPPVPHRTKSQKKKENTQRRKGAKKAAKQKIAAAGKVGKTAKQRDNNKKTEIKRLKAEGQKKHQDLKSAGQAYQKVGNKPGRNEIFKFPGDPAKNKPGIVATGKDVRAAIFAGQYRPNQNGRSKNFKNYNHKDPGSSGTSRPIERLPNNPSDPKLKEYTLTSELEIPARKKDHNALPGRVILSKDKNGNKNFEAVVGHDQSRGQTDPGFIDHFEVKPQAQ